jgi:hypothetical protein
VTRRPVECELQHDLGRTRRPSPLAFDVLEAFEETADVEQQTAELGTGRVDRLMHALTRSNHRVGKIRALSADRSAAPRRNRAHPVRRGARHHMGAGEIGTQLFAGLELMRLNQGAPIAATPSRQPGEWAFCFVDINFRAAEFGRDLPLGKFQMLAAKRIDRRRRRFAGFHRLCAHERTCNALPLSPLVRPDGQAVKA